MQRPIDSQSQMMMTFCKIINRNCGSFSARLLLISGFVSKCIMILFQACAVWAHDCTMSHFLQDVRVLPHSTQINWKRNSATSGSMSLWVLYCIWYCIFLGPQPVGVQYMSPSFLTRWVFRLVRLAQVAYPAWANVPSKLCARTSRETSAHKKTWSSHKFSFKNCFCTYFIHVASNTDEPC